MNSSKPQKIHTELRSLSHQIHRFFQNTPGRRQMDSVVGTNGWIIAYLTENSDREVFQKDIEREFGITRSTASKVIDLMEQKGLVERKKVPQDARLRQLILTDKSRKISDLILEDKERLEKTLMRGFSDEEKELLSDCLLRMKKNLEQEGENNNAHD